LRVKQNTAIYTHTLTESAEERNISVPYEGEKRVSDQVKTRMSDADISGRPKLNYTTPSLFSYVSGKLNIKFLLFSVVFHGKRMIWSSQTHIYYVLGVEMKKVGRISVENFSNNGHLQFEYFQIFQMTAGQTV
jgi:hypothetical protein